MPVVRPIPVGHADVAWIFSLINDPEPIMTTFSMDFPTEPTVANANSLHNIFATRFAPVISNQYQLESVHILYQADANNQIAVDSDAVAIQMQGTGTPLPQNCTYLIRKRTMFAGRKNRGRMYIPGVAEASVSSTGELATADLANVQTRATGFLADISAIGVPELIHSCSHLITEPPCVPGSPTTVISLQVDDVIGTQRRRLRR